MGVKFRGRNRDWVRARYKVGSTSVRKCICSLNKRYQREFVLEVIVRLPLGLV